MTRTFEEVKRPENGPITELNNNMQEVFSQYRKMRQYADYLEYELKQKDEHILKVENENSFLRDEHTTFDSEGNSVEPIIQHQPLPEVPEFVAEWYEEHKDELDFAIYEAVVDCWETGLQDDFHMWFGCDINKPIETLIRMKDGYTVQKPKRFYLKNKLSGLWLMRDKGDKVYPYDHTMNKGNRDKYTQEEIDSMDTGSYEKIPVEMSKNGR